MSPSFTGITARQIMQSHSFACPCRILRVALHSPHLPLILSIVPFLCETTDSRAVAYYSPVPRAPLTSSPRAVSRSEVSQKMIAPPCQERRRIPERKLRYRVDLRFYIYHVQRIITRTHAWYFTIKYTVNAVCVIVKYIWNSI